MTNSFSLRTATDVDVETIYRFMCELENKEFNFNYFKSLYNENMQNPDILYFVVTDKQKIVGFISYHTQILLHHCGTVGEIQEFFVDKHYRDKGVGRMLINAVEKHSIEKKMVSIEVTTNKKRTENVQIYQNYGFTLSHNKFTKTVKPDQTEPKR